MNKFEDAGTSRPPIGFGLLRLWDTETRWFDLEPSDNNWSWERMDGLVQLAKSDANTEVLYTLGMTPQWAAQYPGPMGGVYGWGSTSAPRNITDWEDYVTNVVNHDPPGAIPPGSIKYYELWNEVDYGAFWSGGVDKMLELQQSTWNILHPPMDTIVDSLLSPNITNNGLRWFAEYLEKGGGETVDIFAFHYYPQSMMEDAIPYLEAVKSMLRKHGYCCESDPGDCPKCKPIWNTEGAISIDTTILSTEQQRAAVARSYIVQWAFGIENFSWYFWENTASNISLSNYPSAGAAEAGKAYLTTRNWLVGSTMVSKIIDNTVWKIKIIKENGGIAWIVWDTACDNSTGPPENWTKTKITPLSGDPGEETTSIPIGIEPVLLEDASGGGSSGVRIAQKETEPEKTVATEQKHEAMLHLFPNPSSNVVNIQYEVPEGAQVTITIYDSFGHEISSLVNEYRSAGVHSTVFRSDKSSSGVFLCEYKTITSRIVSKIILIK